MYRHEILHYGVKGMKWGVHRNGASAGTVSSRAKAKVEQTKAAIKKDIDERKGHETTVRAKPGQMVRVVGGNKHAPHQDAVNARVAEQIAKKNTLDALSNAQLKQLTERMNLESQYRNLASRELRQTAGEKAISQLMANPKFDVAVAKVLGPHAAVGKQVANKAFAVATRNKAMEGGTVKGDKDKKDK